MPHFLRLLTVPTAAIPGSTTFEIQTTHHRIGQQGVFSCLFGVLIWQPALTRNRNRWTGKNSTNWPFWNLTQSSYRTGSWTLVARLVKGGTESLRNRGPTTIND